MQAIQFAKPYYAEKHRRYHTFGHIETMLAAVGNQASDELRHAILFHDIVYDPWRADNEERSAQVFRDYQAATGLELDTVKVVSLIMATKDHFAVHRDPEAQAIVAADLAVFSGGQLQAYEDGIFWEYQKYPVNEYRKKRCAFLARMAAHFGPASTEGRSCAFLIDQIQSRSYRIGIYAGSFNPYHVGHEDISLQAEALFDKLVLAQGYNRDKERPPALASRLRQVISYDTMLSELFEEEPGIHKTLVRGLRNSFDLAYEDSLRNTLLDFRELSVVYFFCQKKYEHVSSGMIRSMYPFGVEAYGRYLVE